VSRTAVTAEPLAVVRREDPPPRPASPDRPFTAALANWLWLADVSPAGDVLIGLLDGTDATSGLERAFARAWSVDLMPWAGRRSEGSVGLRFACADAAFDAVVVPQADLAAAHPEAIVLFREARRVVRAPGGVYVGIERVRSAVGHQAPGPFRRLTAIRRVLSSQQIPLLRAAGFGQVRAYYVEESPAHPWHLVPASRGTVAAWDRALRPGDWRGLVRRAAARGGLHGLLFRYRLVVARP
jgi:hypothetical protein